MRRWWKKEEIDFLIENYGSFSCLEMSISLNRTHKSVESKVLKLLTKNIINRKNDPVKIGDRCGRLVIISKSPRSEIEGHSYFICKCDCGNETESAGNSLNSGTTKSCGCYARERIRETVRLKVGESTYNRIEATYKINAKNNKIPYDLSKDQFMCLISQNCHYCNDKPKPKNRFYFDNGDRNKISPDTTEEWAKEQWINVNGIDRIDSNKGYSIDNCVTACWTCNEMKNNSRIDDFLLQVNKISNFQKEKNK